MKMFSTMSGQRNHGKRDAQGSMKKTRPFLRSLTPEELKESAKLMDAHPQVYAPIKNLVIYLSLERGIMSLTP